MQKLNDHIIGPLILVTCQGQFENSSSSRKASTTTFPNISKIHFCASGYCETFIFDNGRAFDCI